METKTKTAEDLLVQQVVDQQRQLHLLELLLREMEHLGRAIGDLARAVERMR